MAIKSFNDSNDLNLDDEMLNMRVVMLERIRHPNIIKIMAVAWKGNIGS